MKVLEHMKSPVEAIQSSKTIRQAASHMKSSNIGSLLVIHNKQLGILTERDLVFALAEFGENTTIQSHYSSPVIKIHQDKEILDAAKQMLEKRIRRLAVENDEGKIVGIINMRDVVLLLEDKITS